MLVAVKNKGNRRAAVAKGEKTMSDVIKIIATSSVNSDDKIQMLSQLAMAYKSQVSTIEAILHELLEKEINV